MNKLLALYDKEVRANPAYPDTIQIIRDNNLVKLAGPDYFDFISYWNFPANRSADVIQQEVNDLQKRSGQLMWRVFDHDLPPNLETVLEKTGFTHLDSVTLMVLNLQSHATPEPKLDIQRVRDTKGLVDFLAVTEKSFGEASPQSLAYHSRLLAYPNFKYYLAFENGQAVAAARFEIPDNSRFGLFFGGCVLPEYRGKGYYQSLVNKRLLDAKKLGLEFISIEAKASSRAIMKKHGFIPLSKGRTWYLKFEHEK